MIPCPLSAAGCDVRTLSSLTLMMCMSCLLQTQHVRRTTFSKNSCWWAQGSSSTQGRPERGIAEGHNLQIWKSWGRKCGVQAARFWALLWGRLSLSAVWSSEGWKTRANCGKWSLGFPISSVGGKYFCNVQGPDATTSSAHCHRVNLPSTLNDTTMACGRPCRRSWAGSRALRNRS